MDEKMIAVVGAVAGVTVAGRSLRPLAKLAMRGVVAAADLTTEARREVAQMYAEAKAEQRGPEPDAAAAASAPPAAPA